MSLKNNAMLFEELYGFENDYYFWIRKGVLSSSASEYKININVYTCTCCPIFSASKVSCSVRSAGR